MEKSLIIPAAGAGSRLRRETPKPFIPVGGKTILEHTVSPFLELEGLISVIIPTSPEFIDRVEALFSDQFPPDIECRVIAGGKERQHSIYNASKVIGDAGLVIVHDAVRPFVKLTHIEACCQAAEQVGASLLGVPAKDTIKRVDGNRVVRETPSRKRLWQAQTPQVFRKSIFVEAHRKAMDEEFLGTDDASLVERIGYEVKIVVGDRMNFKITYPLDLKLAELLIKEE